MEETLSNVIGWILLPIYWLMYPGRSIGGGCLIDIFTVKLGKHVRIGGNCRIGPNVTIDNYTYITNNARISNVSIGKFNSIGANLRILPYGHNYKRFSTYPFSVFMKGKPKKIQREKEKVYYGHTTIENDIWIGDNVNVIGGSTIKDGAVIGTCTLIKGKIKQFGIYAGVPAKFIKFRFSKQKIKEYTKNPWYNKPFEEIYSLALKS